MNLCDMNCDDVLKWLSTFMSNSDLIKKFKGN